MKPLLFIPIAFGHWLIEGNRLVCRLPRKNVTIKAPKKLLTTVMHYCDGSRSWVEVLGSLEADWDSTMLESFMQALVQEGVLVESSLLWAHWADMVQLPTITATMATHDLIGTLHQAAEKRLLPGRGKLVASIQSGHNALAQTLAKRKSTRTFDDKAISIECLCSVLWAAHGVIRSHEGSAVAWHRTIASGGNMHSARWFVLVLRELVSEESETQLVAPGIYEARFHKHGGASLRKMAGDVKDAWRCLCDPRVLRFASALVIPVYDVSVPAQKYGNRATLYAAVESGQALQNAQLMAFELGASGMLRGDTIAHECLNLLGLKNGASHWFSVPSMVLGACATHEQLKEQQLENAIKITPNLRLQGESFAFASSLAVADDESPFVASGRSYDPKLALTKAEAECWERAAWASPIDVRSGKFTIGRFGDVSGAVDPNTLVAYSQRQYDGENFPFTPFSLRRQYLWVDAVDVASGQKRRLLSDCVYASLALPARFQKYLYTNTSTSGMAAGVSQEDAFCRATLELIERDAFALAWISRRAPPIIKKSSLPRAVMLRIKALNHAGFRIIASNISSSLVPVISVFAQSELLPFTAITASAHFSVEEALNKALEEMEGRIAHAQHFPRPSIGNKSVIAQIERRYRSRRSYKKSDFYVQHAASVPLTNIGNDKCVNWAQLKARFFRDAVSLFSVDTTPQDANIHQGRIPLHVVRAVIPGFVPMWFQDSVQPSGLSRFLEASGIAKKQFGKQSFIHPFT